MNLTKNFKNLNGKVNKYTLDWQILRVNLKNKDLSLRFNLLDSFFLKNKTEENCIRILNYLEGLIISSSAKDYIAEKIFFYKKELNSNLHKEKENNLNFGFYSLEDKFKLFKDLFNRNKKWLKKGYYHKGQNNFLNFLLFDLVGRGEERILKYKKELEELQKNCSFIENTYKFIY